ncbi:hypothetical protein FACS189499_10160 [Clostridia bacterium]|nr:hypothetical protein FACS189499_10160 [Clostridia bacterium]
MAALTRNALLEIEREKDFTPKEAVAFLHKRENFMSMGVGLKRELRKREDCPADDEQLLPYFKEVLKSTDFTKDQRKNADVWLIQGKLPTPHYAIRLCFAFGLTGQDALTFFWNCCKVNGFNCTMNNLLDKYRHNQKENVFGSIVRLKNALQAYNYYLACHLWHICDRVDDVYVPFPPGGRRISPQEEQGFATKVLEYCRAINEIYGSVCEGETMFI